MFECLPTYHVLKQAEVLPNLLFFGVHLCLVHGINQVVKEVGHIFCKKERRTNLTLSAFYKYTLIESYKYTKGASVGSEQQKYCNPANKLLNRVCVCYADTSSLLQTWLKSVLTSGWQLTASHTHLCCAWWWDETERPSPSLPPARTPAWRPAPVQRDDKHSRKLC